MSFASPSPCCSALPTQAANLPGQSRGYLVQCLLKHSFCIIPLALGHVAGCLPIEQQEGGGAFVCHLLEDVVSILELLPTLPREEMNTKQSQCCKAWVALPRVKGAGTKLAAGMTKQRMEV